MPMEPCVICKKPADVCKCDLSTLVAELSTIADNPVMCSVCKEKPPQKFGICFSCLSDYGLDKTDDVGKKEEYNLQSNIGQVIVEEERDNFNEVPDPDFEDMDDFDDESDFDASWEDDEDWEEEEDEIPAQPILD